MRYCTTNYFEKRQDHFVCANYRSNTGSCSAHFIRAVVLEELVWMHMKAVIFYVTRYEKHFRTVMEQRLRMSSEEAIRGYKTQFAQAERRLAELDRLFIRIYEDNVSGKLSDDRFARMSKRYEEEQKELAEKIKALRAEIDKQSSQSMTTDMFISLVRKYTSALKLTPRMLNELIEKIEVFNAEKIDGVWEQRLRIHYNCVGVVEIPELIPLPAPEVSVNTRKGVVVNYAPSTIAG